MPKNENILRKNLESLKADFEGDIHIDNLTRIMYATDASVYRELPLGVCYPKHKEDIILLINFAQEKEVSLIPRTAGTSLAGQVVGNGIVVDVSKYITSVIKIDAENKKAIVQPGVILDELNMKLKPYRLFFGPETSSGNRCMLGGMVGNNSCGAHSLVYGSTREHLISVKVLLSDASEVQFKPLNKQELIAKTKEETLEGRIYKQLDEMLSNEEIRQEIFAHFPDKEVKRRNTGYAIDILAGMKPYSDTGEDFNLSKLIAGSEGTLAFIIEIELNLVELPPLKKALLCVHLHTVTQALEANLIALKYNPVSIELMDKTILELTKENPAQRKNRFFLKGNPGALLIVEFVAQTQEEIEETAMKMIEDMYNNGYGFHFPLVCDNEINKVWDLRKAGLGVLSSMPGDAKPVSVVEDTAVSPQKLPAYINDFDKILKKYQLNCVYYAHIGTGELHLRPILNLKNPKHVELFKTIAYETACLVKKYGGSLSGEHGDGRLRGEFIPLMLGEKNYERIKDIKNIWDPNGVFNKNKIVDTPSMNTNLRYVLGKETRKIKTIFDFAQEGGILRAVEKCNGSADCRRTHLSGGTMCPSYMATLDEKHTTRARANVLREFLTNSKKSNPFDHTEIHEILDLCLSCKACKSECPSNVDMTKFKAEFLQHYYDEHNVPGPAKALAYITKINRLAMLCPSLYNSLIKTNFFANILKNYIGFAKQRQIPLMPKVTLRKWAKKYLEMHNPLITASKGQLILFIDEFSNYQDADIGKAVIMLLTNLGYNVQLVNHKESGRTFLSKGLLRKARNIAQYNVNALIGIINSDNPLVGIEPSAILSFRDEYIDLCGDIMKPIATRIAKNTFLFEEFILKEFEKGNITKKSFTTNSAYLKMHGHCHQKAIANTEVLKKVLEIPENYKVEEIKSGCCGMAGSYGLEKEHYEVSMKIGELVLFPAVRDAKEDVLIVAPGTSCRQQIEEGTGRKAIHPAQALYDALKMVKR